MKIKLANPKLEITQIGRLRTQRGEPGPILSITYLLWPLHIFEVASGWVGVTQGKQVLSSSALYSRFGWTHFSSCFGLRSRTMVGISKVDALNAIRDRNSEKENRAGFSARGLCVVQAALGRD